MSNMRGNYHGNRSNNPHHNNQNQNNKNQGNFQNQNQNYGQNQHQGNFNQNQNNFGQNQHHNQNQNQNQHQNFNQNNQNQGFNNNSNNNQNQGFHNNNRNNQQGNFNPNQNQNQNQNQQGQGQGQNRQFNQNRPQGNNNNIVAVRITGHDPSWDFKTFQAAINSLFSARWKSNDHKPNQQVVQINVQRHEAQRLVQAVNGNQINGFNLQAMIVGNEANQPLTTILQSFAAQHEQGIFLDLSNLQQRLQAGNVRFSWTDRGNINELSNFFLAHGSKFFALNLNGNNLDLDTTPQNHQVHGLSIRRLLQQCSRLTHISLKECRCDRIDNFLSVLASIKHSLTAIELSNELLGSIWNTIQQPFSTNQQPDTNFIMMSIHQWLYQQFPLLTTVNSDPIQPFIKLTPQPTRALAFPNQSQSLFIHPGLSSCQHLPPQFLTNFFQVFDNNRQELANIYDAASTFSLSLASDITDADACQLTAWTSVQHPIRNLNAGFGAQTLLHGAQSIIQVFSQLPPTQHDLDSLSCDAIPIPLSQSEFMIQVTGRLLQPNQNGNDAISRYFSRTFLLAYNGTSFLVKNDQLFLHSTTKAPES